MHKGHLAGCAIGIVVALGFVAFTGGSAGGLGVLVAAIACPVAMVVAMKFLMGGNHTGHARHGVDPERPTAETEPA